MLVKQQQEFESEEGGGQSHPKNLNLKKGEERKIERKKQGNFLNPEIMKILKRGGGGVRCIPFPSILLLQFHEYTFKMCKDFYKTHQM